MYQSGNAKINQSTIPPKTECPMKEKCVYKNICWHEGVNHKTSFRCAELSKMLEKENV